MENNIELQNVSKKYKDFELKILVSMYHRGAL